MSARSRWSRTLRSAGAIAMVAGALDPLEGSIVVVVGSALLVGSEVTKEGARRHVGFWASVFLLMLVGTVAMFVLSSLGGIGGNSGRAMGWGLLMLPYPAGWFLGVGRLAADGIRALRDRYVARER